MKRVALASALALTLPVSGEAQESRTVIGTVRSATDSTVMTGVRVRLLEVSLRAASGPDGRFILRGVPDRAVRLVLERIGVYPDTVSLTPGQVALTVYLRARPVALSPLVTVGALPARDRFVTLAQTSTASLDPSEIASVPALAEPDVARVVQLLPGVVAKNDFSVGLNVRGGGGDQNLTRLDGVTVFNPFHLGGLFSTFDAAAVSRVDFMTGGFPAGFGGRLSSVLDVELRSGNPQDTDVRGAVSLLAGKLLVDGPIGGTGATYLVGARRSYADALVDAFSDEVFTYYLGDALAKVTVPLWAGGRLSATGYWGRDVLDFQWLDPQPGRDGVDLEFAWGNRLAGLTLRQPLGPVEWEQHVSISEFTTRLALVPSVLRADNSARVFSARTSIGFASWRTHAMRMGVGVDDYSMVYDFERPNLGVEVLDLAYHPTVWSAFVDDQWRPFDALLVRPGLRVEHTTGADFTAVAPRVALKVFATDDLAVTGSAGRYYQSVHSIRDQELPVTLFDFWIGADDLTPVARSDHAVLGIEQWFGTDVSLSVEGYLKSFHHVLMRDPEDDLRVRGDEFLVTTGDAWGADVLLRKYRGPIRGWLAYALAKTIRRADAEEFPPAHDRRHTVDVVVEAPGPLGSRMTVRWGYGSPLPYTGIVGQWMHREYNAARHEFDESEDEVLSTTINGERFPHYSRLDVGLRWEVRMWGATWRPHVQVINVYDRRNVFAYTFDYEAVPPTRSGYSQLPVFPTFGVEVEW